MYKLLLYLPYLCTDLHTGANHVPLCSKVNSSHPISSWCHSMDSDSDPSLCLIHFISSLKINDQNHTHNCNLSLIEAQYSSIYSFLSKLETPSLVCCRMAFEFFHACHPLTDFSHLMISLYTCVSLFPVTSYWQVPSEQQRFLFIVLDDLTLFILNLI